jgi:hypothetical protein
MVRREVYSVVESALTNLVCFLFVEPFDSLAHLPDSELGTGGFGTEVNTKSVLFVLVPPAFEAPIVCPLVKPVAFSSVAQKLTSVFISTFKNYDTHSSLHISHPVACVGAA